MLTENRSAGPFGHNGRTFQIYLSALGALGDFIKPSAKACFA